MIGNDTWSLYKSFKTASEIMRTPLIFSRQRFRMLISQNIEEAPPISKQEKQEACFEVVVVFSMNCYFSIMRNYLTARLTNFWLDYWKKWVEGEISDFRTPKFSNCLSFNIFIWLEMRRSILHEQRDIILSNLPLRARFFPYLHQIKARV